MRMWHVHDGRLVQVTQVSLDNEQRLEDWLEADPGLLGMDLMMIGRQVTTDHGGASTSSASMAAATCSSSS